MKWTEFNESTKEYPEVVVENAISGFSNATKKLAELGISKKSEMGLITSRLTSKFQFDLDLFSDQLEDYSFTVLEFGYDIELFPVRIKIEPTILAEINKNGELSLPKIFSIDTEENFKKILDSIFSTERFKEIVAGLMKIAKKSDTF